MKTRSYILLLCCILISTPTFAQQHKANMDKLAGQLHRYTDSTTRSAVYLSTSKGIYESGEDMWFKAYSLDAQQYSLYPTDKTLYVQLIKEDNDSIAWKEKYHINQGIASGHVYLDDMLPAGNYSLVAYSAHSPFSASRRIRIIKDFASLARTSSPIQPQSKIQFDVFPEGGYLVAGLMNHVAFKCVDNKGIPVDVSGTLLEDDKPIQEISPVHAGMGSFKFKPQSGKKYHIRLKGNDSLYAVPAVKENGVLMQLAGDSGDSLLFKIFQHHIAKQTVYLRLQVRGVVQMIASGTLSDSLQMKLSTKHLANGIAEVTLFDDQLRPLAERLVYINPDQQLYITTSISKATYAPKEKVIVKIKTTNKAGTPVPAEIGVSVFDKLYDNPEDAKDILTHYYLSTQLKGRIYDPGYYFNADNKNREQALDLLLLTQGWRAYQWNETTLASEKHDSIPDNLEGRLVTVKKKKDSPAQKILMLFNIEQSESSMIPVDNTGRFSMAPEDFVSGRWAYLKHFGAENEVYRIDVNDPFMLKKEPYYPMAAIKTNKDNLPASMFARGHINLKEVEIIKKKAPVFRDKYMGKLDSMAKAEMTTDYAHGGWLNCPACSKGEKPVEGQKYITFTGKNIPTSHPFYFTKDDIKEVIYHYPTFTEEELLKKFKLTRVKGYYEDRKFYNPAYEQYDALLPDYRNTLLWAPSILTDENGEATIEFLCSDINSGFSGVIEGTNGDGLLGKTEFQLRVVK